MITAVQLSPGSIVELDKKIYRVETSVKVAGAKNTSFIKVKLRDLVTDEVLEKNFKPEQSLKEVVLAEKMLEYLYPENQNYLFLDINTLEQVIVSNQVLADKVDFLKEGIQIRALCYGEAIFSIEMPPFLELMIIKVENQDGADLLSGANTTKSATLETGAKIQVPLFIENGDIVKVDTQTNEYIQRV